MFAQRLIQPELLDHLPAEVARPNLRDLVRINTHFGGHSVVRRTLTLVVSELDSFTLLDIGAASGDTARLISSLFPKATVTSLDRSSTNCETAPYPKLLADAFELPFRENTFDFVLCCLFLHHFNDDEVVRLLHSFYGVARKALLVCDLERHVIPYVFLPVTKRLFGWNDVTVHDGVISVRASFRKQEMLHLFQRAGITGAKVQSYRPAFRLTAVAEK